MLRVSMGSAARELQHRGWGSLAAYQNAVFARAYLSDRPKIKKGGGRLSTGPRTSTGRKWTEVQRNNAAANYWGWPSAEAKAAHGEKVHAAFVAAMQSPVAMELSDEQKLQWRISDCVTTIGQSLRQLAMSGVDGETIRTAIENVEILKSRGLIDDLEHIRDVAIATATRIRLESGR